MNLYEALMSSVHKSEDKTFSSDDWSNLGMGSITDPDTIEAMLAAGYDAIAD